MNTRILWIVFFIIGTAITLQAAENARKGYIALGGRVSELNSENTELLDAKAGLSFAKYWTVGLTGSVFSHDEKLQELVDDGTYHLNIAYGGMFIERRFPITGKFETTVSLMTGQGTAFYQYDQDYRKEKVWTEEIIDQTTFGVQELSLELNYNIATNFWLGVVASARNTSPVELIDSDNDMLKKAAFGINLKYVIK